MKPTPRVLRRGLAVAAVFLAGVVWATPKEEIVLEFVYSPDAKDLLAPQIDDFNDAHEGEIRIAGIDEPSGRALTAIEAGSLQPDLWMPASSAWASLLNHRSDLHPVPADNPSFFWSPEVIAMWGDVRRAIEDSELREVGWEQLVALSKGDVTFEGLGQDEDLDPFRLGHTKPTRSTSGLFALASEFRLASGTDELSIASVGEPANRDEVRSIESSIVHYGDIADDFCPLLADYRSQYVSALYLQETTLLRCIDDYEGDLGGFLSGVVPTEGTYVADYPLIVLDAPWTVETRDEADAFVSWLAEHVERDDTRSLRFRYGSPWDGEMEEPPSVDAVAEAEIVPPLSLPDAEALDGVQTAWLELRKRANILFVLDRSPAMMKHHAESKDLVCAVIDDLLDEAEGTQPHAQDRVGIDIFNDDVEATVALTPVEEAGDSVCRAALGTLSGSSDVVLIDAVGAALRPPIGEQEEIDLVVVVASGEDTASETTMAHLRANLEALAEQRSPVQVVTVSFETRSTLLTEISGASRTGSFIVTPDVTVEDVADALAALV